MKHATKIITASMLFIALCMFSITGSVYAAPFITGDVFAGTGSGTVEHWRAGTGLVASYSTGQGGYETGMAFDSSGNLNVTNFSASNVTRFDTNGAVLGSNPFISNDSSAHNESIVFDQSGNFYVGQPDGTADVLKYAADGTFLARFDVPDDARGTDWIDLAADQTTLYYTSEGRKIQRWNVGTNSALADFATLPGSGNAFALRLLGDGGVIVADGSDIKRLNSSGTVVQTYDVAGQDNWFALNRDPDGTTFWSADYGTGLIQQFDLLAGTTLISFNSTSGGPWGLAVFGEITEGGPEPGCKPIPEPATMTLLGAGLAGLAFVRRKIKKQ